MFKNNFFPKLLILAILVVAVSGCTPKVDTSRTGQNPSKVEPTGAKRGETTMTGTLGKVGDLYLLTDASGKTQDLESYSIQFDDYLNKTVTVKGKFSGNTLFITTIDVVQ